MSQKVNDCIDYSQHEKIVTSPPRDLEAEFKIMIDGIIPENKDVKEKRQILPEFKFNIRDTVIGLDIVYGRSEYSGETYYGFM